MAITKSTETFTSGDAPSAQDKADLLAAIGAAEATSTAAAIAARETPSGAQAKADAARDAAISAAATDATTKANAAQSAAISAAATDATTKAGAAQSAAIAAAAADATTKAAAAAAASIPLSQKGAPDGVAELAHNGKLREDQLPSIAVVDWLGAAADQTAMLALVGQKGDWCTRTDIGTTWVIVGADPTQISSWTQLSYPTAPVTSVAGRAGAITLAPTDMGLGNVENKTFAVGMGDAAATAASKAAPVDADGLPISDSEASGALKKLTWANVKAALKTYFDALYATAAQGTDSREWSAATVGQAEAEAGAAQTRRAWTAERVRQAVAAWWTATAATLLKTINGQSILGSGDLTVSGGGSPGGSSGQPQYNNAGALGGMAGMTWNSSTSVLQFGGTTSGYMGLKGVAAWLQVRTADDSALGYLHTGVLDVGSGFGLRLQNSAIGMGSGVTLGWTSGSGGFNPPDTAFARHAAGVAEVNNGTAGTFRDLKLRSLIQQPPSSVTPASNGDLVFEATSNTTITVKLKGSDGTVRTGSITLS